MTWRKAKATINHCTRNKQAGHLDGERLQEEDALQRHRRRCTRRLEVAHAREDGAVLHDMVGDEAAERTCCW